MLCKERQIMHVETIALIERVRNAKDFVQIGIDAEEYYRIKKNNIKTTHCERHKTMVCFTY
jgi:hypothetical protein